MTRSSLAGIVKYVERIGSKVGEAASKVSFLDCILTYANRPTVSVVVSYPTRQESRRETNESLNPCQFNVLKTTHASSSFYKVSQIRCSVIIVGQGIKLNELKSLEHLCFVFSNYQFRSSDQNEMNVKVSEETTLFGKLWPAICRVQAKSCFIRRAFY